MKLYPGAAAHDSSVNRSWLTQENGRQAPAFVRRDEARFAYANWEDDGGALRAMRSAFIGPPRP